MVTTAIPRQKRWIIKNYPHTKNYLKRKGILFIIEECNEIVAFAFVQRRNIINEPEKYENLILVIDVIKEDRRKHGLGTELVNAIKDYSLNSNVYQVIAYYEKDNMASHKLWVKNDFNVFDTEDDAGNIIGCVAIWKCK